jgi:hypothetical protein
MLDKEPSVPTCCLDSGDDLDPSLVHCLEPCRLHFGILVGDGADEVVAPAVLVDLVRMGSDDDLVDQQLGQRARSTADRSFSTGKR